jgi:hypothetical protein
MFTKNSLHEPPLRDTSGAEEVMRAFGVSAESIARMREVVERKRASHQEPVDARQQAQD